MASLVPAVIGSGIDCENKVAKVLLESTIPILVLCDWGTPFGEISVRRPVPGTVFMFIYLENIGHSR